MDTLGAILDISVFEGERVPVSRSALTPGTRPLQLLLLPGSDFPVRHHIDVMRGFQSEAERIRPRLAAWRELPADVRPTAPAYTREEGDQAARSFIFYLISLQLLCTSQNKGDPAVLACLRDLGRVGSYDRASLALAHLYHGLDVWTRGSGESNWQFLHPLEVWAYEYRIYPGGPGSDTSADARRIPRYLAYRLHTFSNSEDPHYWRCYLNGRTLVDVYRRTVFMMIMGETMCWIRDIALHVTNFNVLHRGCPMLLQAWALDKLSLIPPNPTRLIPTYGLANFRSRSRGQFDFGDNPVIRWTCPWWRIRLVPAGSMNLNYVLYASLDRSIAYFPDRINRQYGIVQRIPRIHDFESGPMTQSLLTNLADRWRNRNT
ncbi:hypothetical protein JCGZ_03011 [Jatropha curcas]|uniref:Aminotransferase-like plant mobile domain-containing protein n=1 Tax=Jatropha curcas TaxID=180498 RepID=A0A067LDI4_JATCU|nr:hypothetical protein JCGZ_03011 [Jatropha curcas]